MNRDPVTDLEDAVPPINSTIIVDFYHEAFKKNECVDYIINLKKKA